MIKTSLPGAHQYFKPAADPLSGAEFGHFKCVVCLLSVVRMRMYDSYNDHDVSDSNNPYETH